MWLCNSKDPINPVSKQFEGPTAIIQYWLKYPLSIISFYRPNTLDGPILNEA